MRKKNKELTKQGFFETLGQNLYSDNFEKCSWTIYAFGKFSHSENAIFLESAYIQFYIEYCPILASRCLCELDWLNSEMMEKYLDKLYADNDLFSKLTLLMYGVMYWENCGETSEMDRLLSDKGLIEFISPHNKNISKAEIIYPRLNNLENHIFQLHREIKTSRFTKNEFMEVARKYFEDFK